MSWHCLLVAASASVVLASVSVASAGAPAAAAKPPVLVKGDRIVFLGDSITQQGGGPKGYVTLVRNTLDVRVSGLGIETVNAGISGNKVPDLQQRLQKDVLDKKPTIVFIYIGINDVWHYKKQPNGELAGGTPKDKYEEGLRDIIARIRAAGARPIICTPSVIGEKTDGSNEYDKMLDEYSDISRNVAKDAAVQLLDLHRAFRDAEKAKNTANRPSGVLTGDGVHLNDAGNALVAAQMLGAIGMAGAPVAAK